MKSFEINDLSETANVDLSSLQNGTYFFVYKIQR